PPPLVRVVPGQWIRCWRDRNARFGQTSGPANRPGARGLSRHAARGWGPRPPPLHGPSLRGNHPTEMLLWGHGRPVPRVSGGTGVKRKLKNAGRSPEAPGEGGTYLPRLHRVEVHVLDTIRRLTRQA